MMFRFTANRYNHSTNSTIYSSGVSIANILLFAAQYSKFNSFHDFRWSVYANWPLRIVFFCSKPRQSSATKEKRLKRSEQKPIYIHGCPVAICNIDGRPHRPRRSSFRRFVVSSPLILRSSSLWPFLIYHDDVSLWPAYADNDIRCTSIFIPSRIIFRGIFHKYLQDSCWHNITFCA